MSDVGEWLSLLSQVRSSLYDGLRSQMQTEAEFVLKYKNWRDDGNVSLKDYLSKGILVNDAYDALANERKFTKLWDKLSEINRYGIPDDTIRRYENEALQILTKERDDPMWFEVSAESITTESFLPAFRIASTEHRSARLLSQGRDDLKHGLPAFEKQVECDRLITVRNDLHAGGVNEVRLSKLLNDRLREETDPHYYNNPVDSLILVLLYIKTECPSFYSVGVEYLHQACLTYGGGEFRTYPAVFSTNGECHGASIHSQSILKLRYVLNSLIGLYFNKNTHATFNDVYIEVFNEVTMYMLTDPTRGRALKKTLNPINLYFGHHVNDGEEIVRRQDVGAYGTEFTLADDLCHSHHIYDTTFLAENEPQRNLEFKQYESCPDRSRCSLTTKRNVDVLNTIYKQIIAKELRSMYVALDEMELFSLKAFIKDRLVYFKPHPIIIGDVIFVRILMNSGGYSRTNKMHDFISEIEPALKKNKEFERSEACRVSEATLGSEMRISGHEITQKLLLNERYPTARSFTRNLNRWITSKSAGIGSVKVSATVGEVNYSASSTSKAVFLATMGGKILDLSTVRHNTNKFSEWRNLDVNNMEDGEMKDVLLQMLNGKFNKNVIMHAFGISRIGSRSTTAWRAIRAIYINPLPCHLAMAAVMGPLIDKSSRRPDNNVGSMWIQDGEFGTIIATQFMDGSNDLVAPSVMATTNGSALCVQADCAHWDLTFLVSMINFFFLGMKDAFSELGPIGGDTPSGINDTKPAIYMYNGTDGVTLMQICDWIMQFMKSREFYAEYCGMGAIFDINYMISGRLDTFMMNSINNGLIQRQIATAVKRELSQGCKTVWAQVAGDDATSVIDIKDVSDSDLLTLILRIRSVVVDIYTSHNKEINEFKTMISPIGGEYAKIYWYCGMVFRDPSVQLVEAEKDSKADTPVARYRGIAQKMQEYNRRSLGVARMNASLSRCILSCGYVLKLTRRDLNYARKRGNEVNTTIVRFTPPYQSIIAPTQTAGGLGASISGLIINELTTIYNDLWDFLMPSISVIQSMKYTANDIIVDSLFMHSVSQFDDKKVPIAKELVRGEVRKVANLSITSDNPYVEASNLLEGVGLIMNKNESGGIDMSRNALQNLKGKGITVPSNIMYEYQSLGGLRDAITSFPRTKVMKTTDIMDIVTSLNGNNDYNFSDGMSAEMKKIFIMQRCYKFTLKMSRSVEPYGEMLSRIQQKEFRYVSAPSEMHLCEMMYGTRTGSDVKGRLYNSIPLLRQYITRSGMNCREDALMDYIRSVISMTNRSTNIVDVITQILISAGGSSVGAYEAATAISRSYIYFGDANIKASIIGTLMENINIDVSRPEKYGIIMPSNHIVPPTLRPIVVYYALRYLLSGQFFTSGRVSGVVVSETAYTAAIERELMTFKRGGSMKRILAVDDILREMSRLGEYNIGTFKDDNTYVSAD